MKRFLITFLTFASLEFSQSVEPGSDKRQVEYFISNPQSLDYKISGKKDEHRFGVEVKENKQFHHTITAEDGVRLGCYGYDLDGKSHSTHYVADSKGYRLVPHQAVITVYPRDGGEPRQASFANSFTEDEIKSSNIRYLFPEGCQAPKAEVDEIAVKAALESMKTLREKMSAEKAAKVAANGGKTFGSAADALIGAQRNPKQINHRGSSDLSQEIPNSKITTTSRNNGELNSGPNDGTKGSPNRNINGGLKAGINGGFNGGAPGTNQGKSSATSSATPGFNEASGARGSITGGINNFAGLKTGGLNTYLPAKEDSLGNLKSVSGLSSNTCCDENRTQILLSQDPSSGACGQGVSKIVIPIESAKLAKISMAEIFEVTSEANNAAMLRTLLKLVEKYNL